MIAFPECGQRQERVQVETPVDELPTNILLNRLREGMKTSSVPADERRRDIVSTLGSSSASSQDTLYKQQKKKGIKSSIGRLISQARNKLTAGAGYIDGGEGATDTLGRGLGQSEFDRRKRRNEDNLVILDSDDEGLQRALQVYNEGNGHELLEIFDSEDEELQRALQDSAATDYSSEGNGRELLEIFNSEDEELQRALQESAATDYSSEGNGHELLEIFDSEDEELQRALQESAATDYSSSTLGSSSASSQDTLYKQQKKKGIKSSIGRLFSQARNKLPAGMRQSAGPLPPQQPLQAAKLKLKKVDRTEPEPAAKPPAASSGGHGAHMYELQRMQLRRVKTEEDASAPEPAAKPPAASSGGPGAHMDELQRMRLRRVKKEKDTPEPEPAAKPPAASSGGPGAHMDELQRMQLRRVKMEEDASEPEPAAKPPAASSGGHGAHMYELPRMLLRRVKKEEDASEPEPAAKPPAASSGGHGAHMDERQRMQLRRVKTEEDASEPEPAAKPPAASSGGPGAHMDELQRMRLRRVKTEEDASAPEPAAKPPAASSGGPGAHMDELQRMRLRRVKKEKDTPEPEPAAKPPAASSGGHGAHMYELQRMLLRRVKTEEDASEPEPAAKPPAASSGGPGAHMDELQRMLLRRVKKEEDASAVCLSVCQYMTASTDQLEEETDESDPESEQAPPPYKPPSQVAPIVTAKQLPENRKTRPVVPPRPPFAIKSLDGSLVPVTEIPSPEVSWLLEHQDSVTHDDTDYDSISSVDFDSDSTSDDFEDLDTSGEEPQPAAKPPAASSGGPGAHMDELQRMQLRRVKKEKDASEPEPAAKTPAASSGGPGAHMYELQRMQLRRVKKEEDASEPEPAAKPPAASSGGHGAHMDDLQRMQLRRVKKEEDASEPEPAAKPPTASSGGHGTHMDELQRMQLRRVKKDKDTSDPPPRTVSPAPTSQSNQPAGRTWEKPSYGNKLTKGTSSPTPVIKNIGEIRQWGKLSETDHLVHSLRELSASMAGRQLAEKHKTILFAAIDFGTTFSGYAFSFRHDFEQDPLKIFASQWRSGARSIESMKTSTCILFDPNGKFHSFGYEAEEKYSDLVMDDEDHHDWFYFRRFKMHLYTSQHLNRESVIHDDKGKPMKAMTVFTESIRYLKDHMLHICQQKTFGLEPGDISWVLTVPAIWSDAAKQFMRESAELAGIEGSSLSLALEPEAASLFCKHIPMVKTAKGAGYKMECFLPGSKYLVLDAGGGTVDMTVQEVLSDGNIKELLSANGGPWGGTKIDDAFLDVLTKIAGEDVIRAFKMNHAYDYMDMFQEFEILKKAVKPDISSKFRFKIPAALQEEYSAAKGENFKKTLQERPEYLGKLTIIHDKLVANPSMVKRLFKGTCDRIVMHVRTVLADPGAEGIEFILMVGGFSESPMLHDAIHKEFVDKKVIIPEEAGLAVLKGAVIFGHLPHVITARVCRYSYGIKMYRVFVPGVDPEEKKCIIDGIPKCQGHFDKLAEVDQTMSVHDEMPGSKYIPATSDHTAITLKVFASPDRNPRFVDDPGCIPLGELEVSCMDRAGNRTPVFVRIVFGGTELEIRATANTTGETTSAKFDLLR